MAYESGLNPSYWAQFHAQNQMMGGMLSGAGMYGQGMPGMMSEGMMGSAMSRAGGVAGPIMNGAMAMAGLDPLSMGMRGGMAAWNMGGGVMGAGLAGMGMAGATMGVGAVAGFAGNQMYQGASQQMALNQGLRNNFHFMGASGQGFSRGDMGAIGGTIRSMTEQYGPGGEVAGFSELSRLAQNMGKMGMGSGIRDAQDFSKRFKEMVSTLKTVATELGTSLEAAQELLASSRGSGIFKSTDQLRFSGAIRSTSLAGGMATSEVTSMANIGSQISRSVGGLGRSGAFGGIKTIGQVGIAQQVGAISDEDVYNATGLAGAEGRQAYATDLMQKTGSFLRSSKGRYFLASVAGKNGGLDTDAVAEYMGGGVGVGRTKDLAHQNLRGIGRANFIRNEGRLRGSVMEQFGGLAPAIALRGWAGERGVDIDNMDDRSMLFAQRQLGMGRDELDTAVKMAQHLPEIMREQRLRKGDDEYSQARGQSMKRGDIRTKLDQVRESIQGKLEKVGADVFQQGSNQIESWYNKLMGVYERRMSEDIDQVWQQAKMGGAQGSAAFDKAIGKGGVVGAGSFAAAAKVAGGRLQGDAGNPGARADYQRTREMAFSAKNGMLDAEGKAFVAGARGSLLEAYGMGGVGEAQGTRRLDAVGNMLTAQAAKGDPAAQKMLMRYKSGDANSRAAIAEGIEREIGIGAEGRLSATLKGPDYFGGRGGYATKMDADTAVGQMFTGSNVADQLQSGGAMTKLAAGLGFLGSVSAAQSNATARVGSWLGLNKPPSASMGETFDKVMNISMRFAAGLSDDHKKNEAMGRFARSTEGRDLITGLMTGKGDAAKARMAELAAKGQEATPDEAAQLEMLRSTSLGAEYGQLTDGGKNRLSADQLKTLSAKGSQALGRNIGEGDLANFYKSGTATLVDRWKQDISAMSERQQKEGIEGSERYRRLGIADQGTGNLVLSGKTKEGLKGIKNGSHAAEMALAITDAQRSLTGDPVHDSEILDSIRSEYSKMYVGIGAMSVTDKRAFAKQMQGSEASEMALESIGRQKRFEGVMKKSGLGRAAARVMGISMSDEKMQMLSKEGDVDKIAEMLSGAAGAKGEAGAAFRKDLTSALTAGKAGKSETGDLFARALAGASDDIKKNIKRGQDEQTDPIGAETRDAIKEQTDFIKKLPGQIAESIKLSPVKVTMLGGPDEKQTGANGSPPGSAM